MDILISVVGIFVLLGIAVLFSNNRKAINLRTVFGALAIQIAIGAFVLYVPAGRSALQAASDFIGKIISFGNEGISFLFGGLTDPSQSFGFIFAIKVLPVIIFFSALISLLYYIGVMQWLIKLIGGGLQKLLGTSKAESMTQSELFAVMVGGVASIAGTVMAGYAGMGVPLTYLIAASFMAAPGGLLFAKIMFPQTEKTDDSLKESADVEKPSNAIEALANGARDGMHLAMNVGAMLIAFVSVIALINWILSSFGGIIGEPDLTLQLILGWIFKPLAYLIGISWEESAIAGQMIGLKLAVNEFVGYLEFAKYLQPDSAVVLSDKTKAIITFALCGFANFSSIAILIGGLGGMAPNRRSDVARLGLKAVVAGSLSNLMSATIAGLFIGLSGAVL